MRVAIPFLRERVFKTTREPAPLPQRNWVDIPEPEYDGGKCVVQITTMRCGTLEDLRGYTKERLSANRMVQRGKAADWTDRARKMRVMWWKVTTWFRTRFSSNSRGKSTNRDATAAMTERRRKKAVASLP